ncbi:MAG: Ig-like domain-containing protein [Gammaproteobacteria bacterium]|nr:Ig-like domain-containing protein [Gammaproteobacteria bacterium]
MRRFAIGVLVAQTLLPAPQSAAQSPGVTVTPTSLTIQEGATGSYTVVLNTQPTATVTISVTASDDSGKCHDASGASCTRKSGVATVDKSSLTFTTTDWNTAQTVTVTATDEDMAGVFKHAKVEHEASGGGYDSLTVAQVLVTVTDDDVRDIVYQTGSPGNLIEFSALSAYEGSTGSYYVSLKSEPTAATTVTFASQDTGRVKVSTDSLTFSTTNWNVAQPVSFSVADNDVDGRQVKVRITSTLSGTGSDYSGYSARAFTVNVEDNDTRDIRYWTGSPGSLRERSSFGTYEGSTHSYYVSLKTEPTAATTVALASDDVSRVTMSPDSLTFLTTDWSVAQAVSFSVADNDVLGEAPVQVEITSTFSGTGSDYAGYSAHAFEVNVYNNDVAPDTVTVGESFVHEFGYEEDFGTFTVRVESIGEVATVAPASAQVTPDNYQALPFTVTGIAAGQGKINFWGGDYLDRSFLVTVLPSASPAPTVTLSASPNPVREGSSVTVTARLSAALTDSVTIPLTLTAGTAEADDYGSLSGIAISAGSITGTGTVTTSADSDTESESFTVALGSLPSSLRAGSPSSVEVTVSDTTRLNRAPTVKASCNPCRVRPGGEVQLMARVSDPDGDSLSCAWSAPTGKFMGPVNKPTARWQAPAEAGTVWIKVRVSDGAGGTGSSRVAVKVNTAPAFTERNYTFRLPENRDGRVHPVRLGNVLAEDADGDEVTHSLAWGDETRFMVGARSGMVSYIGPGEDYETGTNRYRLGVRARDSHRAAATVTVTISVTNVNEAPEAAADTVGTVEDEPVTVDVLANDTDVDGDTLHIESVSQPEHGTARIAAGVRVEYAPEANWHGTDRFTYTAADGNGGTVVAGVVVVVATVNDRPMAMADTTTTNEDEEVIVDVLANDSDVDGDTLRIESVSQPEHGSARIAAGGRIVYAPEANWHGTDRFVYTVVDGNGSEAEGEVEVRVEPVNDAPVAIADTTTTYEDEPVTADVLANDTDVDGDALRIESVSQPAHGATQIAGGGKVVYTPDTDWHGTDWFVYTVVDGNGGEAEGEVEVRVEPVNDAPVAIADTAATDEDEPVTLDVLENDTDVDGDSLHIESVSQPEHGTARIAAEGLVAYAPNTNWHGTDRFAYVVADGNGGTAQATVAINVAPVNDSPVAVGSIPNLALEEGGAASVLDLYRYFEDLDGDSLTYTATSSDPEVATASVMGSMLTVTPVSYGPASIDVTARDPGGLYATHAFVVGVGDRRVGMVLDETLAAMARAHLASARMTLSRRVGSDGGDELSRLTLRGRSIPLDAAGLRTAAERLLAGWTMQHLRAGGLTETGRKLERQLVGWAVTAAEGRGGSHVGPRDPMDLLVALGVAAPGGLGALRSGTGDTEFMFAWGGSDGGSRAWQLWGQGDISTFVGEPAANRGYEGDLRTGWVGIDRVVRKRWLAGVAIARSTGGADWRASTARGRLETSLTSLHPYLRWSDRVTSVWAMSGGGRGSAENTRATGRVGMSNLNLGLGLLEIRHRFADQIGIRTDAAWAWLATGDGTETVDGRSAAVDQQRLGIELSPSMRVGPLALQAFGETSVRRDGGAGQTGTGLELAGGLRAARGPVRIDAHGRILVLHSAQGYEERGLGVRISVSNSSDDEGFSLSVSPRWGGPTTTSGTLWGEQLQGLRHGPASDTPWSLDAQARGAVRLPGGRLLNWLGSIDRTVRGWGLVIRGEIDLTGLAGRIEQGQMESLPVRLR